MKWFHALTDFFSSVGNMLTAFGTVLSFYSVWKRSRLRQSLRDQSSKQKDGE